MYMNLCCNLQPSLSMSRLHTGLSHWVLRRNDAFICSVMNRKTEARVWGKIMRGLISESGLQGEKGGGGLEVRSFVT